MGVLVDGRAGRFLPDFENIFEKLEWIGQETKREKRISYTRRGEGRRRRRRLRKDIMFLSLALYVFCETFPFLLTPLATYSPIAIY